MSNLTSDELHHAGRKGMKWGMNIFGKRRSGAGGRFRRDKNADPKNVKIPKKLRKHVDERMREAEYLEMYRSRSNMSTKTLKAKIARLEAERKFKELVEAPEKARREALQKKRQARVAFAGKAVSAALDVYSKLPSEIAGRGKTGNAAAEAIKKFKMSQDKVRAFKDVPITMTKITQSGVQMGEIINGVYLPSQDDLLLHYGKKGMKWKKKGEGAIGIGTVGAAPAFQDKALERRAIIERLIAKEHDKSAKKATDPRKVAIRKELKGKAEKNAKDLEKKRENMYNPYRGDKLPKKKIKHSDTSNETLLHYGKKGMKWKKKGEGAQGVGIAGLSPAMQSAPHSQEFNKNTERLAKLYESMTGPTSGKYAEKTKKKRAKVQKEIDELQKKNKKLNAKSEKALSFYNKPTKHSDSSNDILLHYGKKGMKWKKNAGDSAPMTPAELAMVDARTRKEEKSYDYNKKMREKAIENALRLGAPGKEIRKLQDRLADDNRKVAMNKDHKNALKKKDFKRSSYERSYTEVDAANGNKPKIKKYKY